jgi:hypothetical protein
MGKEFIKNIHHQADQEENDQRSPHPDHGHRQAEFQRRQVSFLLCPGINKAAAMRSALMARPIESE